MTNDVFTSTYSDDIIHLVEGRHAILTHPLRHFGKSGCNAASCRILATVMVGNIEAMLESHRPYDLSRTLDAYFDSNTSNGDRIRSLCDAFKQRGLDEQAIFNDYLAIKYIRNAIVHATWKAKDGKLKQDQIDLIESRGFPTDVRRLDETHWRRMLQVHDRITTLIFTTVMSSNIEGPEKSHFPMWLHREAEPTGIITLRDWPRLHWQNLDRISTRIQLAFSQAELPENFLKRTGKDRFDLESGFAYYKSVRASAMANQEPLESMKPYVEDALYSLSQIRMLSTCLHQLDQTTVKEALTNIRNLHSTGLYPGEHGFPIFEADCPKSERQELIKLVFPKASEVTAESIDNAHSLGWLVYQVFPNDRLAVLFGIQLQVIAAPDHAGLSEAAQFVVDATELALSWHSWVEYNEAPRHNLDLIRKCLEHLGKG